MIISCITSQKISKNILFHFLEDGKAYAYSHKQKFSPSLVSTYLLYYSARQFDIYFQMKEISACLRHEVHGTSEQIIICLGEVGFIIGTQHQPQECFQCKQNKHKRTYVHGSKRIYLQTRNLRIPPQVVICKQSFFLYDIFVLFQHSKRRVGKQLELSLMSYCI